MGTADLLRKGEEATAAADWETARACLEKVLEREESPAALTGLSKIAAIQREYERSIELEERAFELFKLSGRVECASRSAYWLTFMYATYAGNFSVASGWKERAASALEGAGDSAATGWVLLLETPFTSDPAERERLATSALATAHRFGDVDLEIQALSILGEARVRAGRIAAGMPLLDEAMAAVTAGRVHDHFATRAAAAC